VYVNQICCIVYHTNISFTTARTRLIVGRNKK